MGISVDSNSAGLIVIVKESVESDWTVPLDFDRLIQDGFIELLVH